MCRTFLFVIHTSPLVTLSSLLVISIERFKATSPTMQAPRPYTMKRRLVILGCCWGLPMLLSGFGLFATIRKKKNFNACSVKITELNYWRGIQICATVVAFLAILTLTLISLRRLQKPQEIASHLTEEQARARMKNTSRAVRMEFLIGAKTSEIAFASTGKHLAI